MALCAYLLVDPLAPFSLTIGVYTVPDDGLWGACCLCFVFSCPGKCVGQQHGIGHYRNILIAILAHVSDRVCIDSLLGFDTPQFSPGLGFKGAKALIGGGSDEEYSARSGSRSAEICAGVAGFYARWSALHTTERDLPGELASVHIDRGYRRPGCFPAGPTIDGSRFPYMVVEHGGFFWTGVKAGIAFLDAF